MTHDARSSSRSRRRLLVRIGRSASFTADVGLGGFCLRQAVAWPVSSAIEGSILVAGEDQPFVARVAWVEPGDRRTGRPGRMGATFLQVTEAFVEYLDPAILARLPPALVPWRPRTG